MLPCEAIPAGGTLQGEVEPTSRSTNGNSSAGSNVERVQSAARAAKRQRGRERRKMYRAVAHESKCLEAEAEHEQAAIRAHAVGYSGFEARAAAVAAEFKLVVKHTFFDVDESEDLSSEDDRLPLPPTFFKSTGEIDEWRRDYRRFRLGHHHGAKGEVTTNDFCTGSMAGLDLATSLETRSRPLAALPA